MKVNRKRILSWAAVIGVTYGVEFSVLAFNGSMNKDKTNRMAKLTEKPTKQPVGADNKSARTGRIEHMQAPNTSRTD